MKEKKHFEKQKKAMGLGGGTSMVKPKEPPKPQMPLDVPRDISQLSAGARELAEKYKVGHKELLPEPDLEDRKKAKPAKPATEVTPAQISAKAQQMVEMVKASQVLLWRRGWQETHWQLVGCRTMLSLIRRMPRG